ncbi:hypothetical protein Tco_1151453 [Tanacetum coccineum]
MHVQGVADSDTSKPARGRRRFTLEPLPFLFLKAWHRASFLNFFKGKRCEKNYSSVRRYVADLVNAYPKQSITKLILKGAVTFDVVSYQFRCALNYSKLVSKL